MLRASRAVIIAFLSGVGMAQSLPCDAAPREIPIAITESSDRPDPRKIADYASAIDAIVRVLMQKFDLPVPRHTFTIYRTREEFEAALIEHMRLAPALAQSTASFAQAAVGGQRILVNEVEVEKLSWPERIELIAHEITHTVQLELAGHRSLVRQQWLTEGFAEWIAYSVTESLGLDDLSRQRARIIALLRAEGGVGSLPSLAEMNTLAQFIGARRKYGFAATFSHSFLIVECLMKRHSFGAVVEYFRHFKVSGNYAANFHLAFGEKVEDFEAESARCLTRLLI